jgi:hypothetical protein
MMHQITFVEKEDKGGTSIGNSIIQVNLLPSHNHKPDFVNDLCVMPIQDDSEYSVMLSTSG